VFSVERQWRGKSEAPNRPPPWGREITLFKCCALLPISGFYGRMQFRQSQLKGDRPVCPADPNHIVHGNGRYQRRRKPDGDEQVFVACWNCTECSHSFSVLPDDMVPYRPISTGQLESELESAFCGKDPPHRTENEKGCLNRARKSFIINIPFLTKLLGQVIKTTRPSAAELWKELRKLGDLKEILLYLATHFKTSLLKTYRCLKLHDDTLSRGVRSCG